MRGRFQQISVVLSVAALALAAAAPRALAAGGCGGPAESALNQYCESIPSASGGQPPHIRMPTLATALPSRVVGRIEQNASGGGQSGPSQRDARAQRFLLTLPALSHPGSTQRAAISEDSALPLSLILVLVAALLALGAAAAARWRRRHTPEG